MGPRHVFTCVRIRGATRPLTTRVPRRVLSVTGSGFDLNPAGFFGPGPQVPGTRIPVSNVSLWSAGLTIPPETLQIRNKRPSPTTTTLEPKHFTLFQDSGLKRDPACLGLAPDEEELQIAIIIQPKTEGGSCVKMHSLVPFDACNSLSEVQSKYALSSTCQARLRP